MKKNDWHEIMKADLPDTKDLKWWQNWFYPEELLGLIFIGIGVILIMCLIVL
jgi:hypothetical protein